MKYLKNSEISGFSLAGKTAAITGPTGGIGRELCRYILALGGSLILLDRNSEKSEFLSHALKSEFKTAEIIRIAIDLEDIRSVNTACSHLKELHFDYLIHNAGVYDIPRRITDCGFDNVFQINFVSPYYMTEKLLPVIEKNKAKTVAVGSIAYNYSKTDITDFDFRTRKYSSLCYGNSKRFLMFAFQELMQKNKSRFAIAHPGITVTSITAHYPDWIYKIIKKPMEIIFMKPEKAALSIIYSLFLNVPYGSWIGPRFFNIWGKPSVKKIKAAESSERITVFQKAEDIYSSISLKTIHKNNAPH